MYTPKRIDGRTVWYRGDIRCIGPQDTSPAADQYHPGRSCDSGEERYDGTRCPACYLGYGHTSDYHRMHVTAYENRRVHSRIAYL